MIRLLKNERGMALAVLTMLVAILASMTGAALLFSRIDLMISGNYRTGTGALYAADAGVGVALSRLQVDIEQSKAAFGPTPIDASGGYTYRSGKRTDSGPQPIEHTGFKHLPGYSMGTGTGYNPSGFVFHTYDIHVTGMGPLDSSAREIEALGAYGPVPN